MGRKLSVFYLSCFHSQHFYESIFYSLMNIISFALDEIKPMPSFEFPAHTRGAHSLTMEVSLGIKGHRSFGCPAPPPFRKLASWSHLHDSSREFETGEKINRVKNNRGFLDRFNFFFVSRNSNVAARIVDEDQRKRCASVVKTSWAPC